MREEWKSVKQSTWIKVVLVAIILIPTIYAGVFLGSMWDPYGNANHMPVAVVNKDEEVAFQTTTLHIGNDLVENLKGNKAMDFIVTSEAKAKKGLKKGTYYMTIMIPKDFSKNATTLLNDTPTNMVLTYETNPGVNYIASKMDETAIRTIKEQVSATVTQTYADTIFSSVTSLRDGLKEASNGALKLNDGTSNAYTGNQRIQDNLVTLANSTVTFRDGITAFDQGLQTYTNGVASVNDGASAVQIGLQDLQAKSTSLEDGITQLQHGSSSLDSGLQLYTQGVDTLSQGMNNLSQSSITLLDGSDTIAQGVKGVRNALQGMNAIVTSEISDAQKITMIQSLLEGSSQTQGLLPTMIALDEGMSGETGLNNGIIAYTNGVSSLQVGAHELQLSSTSLLNGSSQLNQGVTQLLSTMPYVESGITKLVNGSTALHNGTNTLVQQQPIITKNVNDLQSGAIKLNVGATQLTQGSIALGSGLSQLKDGVNTLSTSLSDGTSKSNINLTSKTSAMLSQPLRVKHKELSTVESNGKAMAPYMMSVGMYVACMAFTLMYPLLNNTSHTKSGFKLWLSKAGIMYTLSSVMALLMVLTLTFVNGLSPQHFMSTCAIAILISAAFMSMVVFFNITLGKIGAFLVLIFMVFQLGGAAGTYPIETSNAFYQAIHPLMPFTYSVEAFRNTLALSSNILPEILVFGSMVIVFSLLSIVFYQWFASIGEEKFHRTHLAQFH